MAQPSEVSLSTDLTMGKKTGIQVNAEQIQMHFISVLSTTSMKNEVGPHQIELSHLIFEHQAG